ncbi:serine/threonine protein kinase [Actinoplanes sp. LDG1-06]|uniref:non-specific serine/threonine protein kinase n=1 Tax=Paractinoplanes ovalisporus TaxID=2810368 RepID=A0ABS2AHZ2_9ACTN|nr:serine/threonine protein kinase [Actinoplanes ovalisporus]
MVHHGFDNVLKRSVAIKLFDETATDVLREARTAAGLSHPNIAQVYDYGQVPGGRRPTPFLVMEFVDGETLADRLSRTGPLRWRQAAGIGAETAAALAAAHAQGLVHRDVNPRNVMLTADGVKVLDFGIAVAAGHSSNGELWGSPAHVAPEQLSGEPAFPAADVYALGLLLFESLTAARAWPGESIGQIFATRHGRPAPRLPRKLVLPREMVRLYKACTADDPGARPSAAAVAEALRRITGPVPHAVSAAAPHRSRRRAMAMGAVAVVAAIVSVVGAQLANGTATPGGREAEAALEGAHPATTSPSPSRPAPSMSPTAGISQTGATTTTVRRKEAPRRETVSPSPSKTATPPATSSPAVPSSPPPTSTPPKPSTSPTPDTSPSPTDPPVVEPTDPPATEPPATTPPVTTVPETPDDPTPEA